MSRFDELSAQLAEMNAKISAIKKEIGEKSRGIIQDLFQSFFDENPEFSTVFWTQYTPHFNDGDECTFGVGSIEVTLKQFDGGTEEDEYDNDRFNEGDYIPSTYMLKWYLDQAEAYRVTHPREAVNYAQRANEQLQKIEEFGGVERCERLSTVVSSLQKALKEIDDEFMEMMFGNHVRVEVKLEDGKAHFEIEEYEHD